MVLVVVVVVVVVSLFIRCSLKDPPFEMTHMRRSWEGGKRALTSMRHDMSQKQKSLSSNLVTGIAYTHSRVIIKQWDVVHDGFKMQKNSAWLWSKASQQFKRQLQKRDTAGYLIIKLHFKMPLGNNYLKYQFHSRAHVLESHL